MRRWLIVLVSVVVALGIAAGSFFGGMAYERSRQSNLQARFFGERGIAPGGFPMATPGAFAEGGGNAPNSPFGRGASGTIKSLEGDTLLLSTAEDVKTVVLSDDTVILHMVSGERGLLQPGVRILVSGERDESGAIHASSIQVLVEEQP